MPNKTWHDGVRASIARIEAQLATARQVGYYKEAYTVALEEALVYLKAMLARDGRPAVSTLM